MHITTRIDKSEWISARQAGRLAGVDEHRPPQWARAGLVRTITLPGTLTRYNRADVEKLIAEALRHDAEGGV